MANDFDQKRQDLTRRIVDKVVNDPQFREAVINNPSETVTHSEFGKDLQELANSDPAGGDVSGYAAKPKFTDSWSICV